MRRAVISVYNKTGIVEFARGLVGIGFEIVSTGGTFNALKTAGVPVIEVAEVTGFPEGMGGRIKTLHPKIFGGILANLSVEEDLTFINTHNIQSVELVVCNLYPFQKTVDSGASFDEVIEMIDVGGPSMLRAAGKNHPDAQPVTDPADYDYVLAELSKGELSKEAKRRLAAKVFHLTSKYDAEIALYFDRHLTTD